MPRETQNDAVRQLFMAVWGLGTVVLLFVVILLVGQMMKTGQDPFDPIREKRSPEAQQAAPRTTASMGQHPVQLYFGDGEGRSLVVEERVMDFSDSTQENCRQALNLLMAGAGNGHTSIFPAQVRLNALYLLESGELVLDFSRDLIAAGSRFKSASFESLLVYGVVNTLTQKSLQAKGSPPVREVRFLFEGSPPQEGFPAHIDLKYPVQPDTAWFAGTPQ